MLRGDITRLCFLNGTGVYQKALASSAEKMSPEELMEFRTELEKEHKSRIKPQLDIYDKSIDSFRMQEGKNE